MVLNKTFIIHVDLCSSLVKDSFKTKPSEKRKTCIKFHKNFWKCSDFIFHKGKKCINYYFPLFPYQLFPFVSGFSLWYE